LKAKIVTLPEHMPGCDRVQIYLNDMQAHEIKMYAGAVLEDREYRLKGLQAQAMQRFNAIKVARTTAAMEKRVRAKAAKELKLKKIVTAAEEGARSFCFYVE
jgi:hypothetical protein